MKRFKLKPVLPLDSIRRPVVKKTLLSLSLALAIALNEPLIANEPSFEQTVNEIGTSAEAVGLAVAVVRGGKIEFLNTFGVREFGQAEVITPQTVFRIASLSKGFAATITSGLIDQGKVSLESPISKFDPHFTLQDASQTASVTLRHVLTHQLSLPPYAYDNLLEAGTSPQNILREMRKVTPICTVGTCYAYQNVGFNMVTSAIESAARQDYASLVKNLIFNPLGMHNASFGRENLTSGDNWARSHQRDGYDVRGNRQWKVREVKQPYYKVPAAGGINASISDMAKWLAAQMGHAPEVIPVDWLKMMHTPIVATPAELRRTRHIPELTSAHYGLGWRIYSYAGETVVNHSGSVEGYVAQIAFLPKYDVGLVLLSNSRFRKFWDILPIFLENELRVKSTKLSLLR